MTSLTAVMKSTITSGISVVYLDVGDTSGICYSRENLSKFHVPDSAPILLEGTCLDAGNEQEENIGCLAEFNI